MKRGGWIGRHAWGLIVGAAVTGCAVAAYLSGTLDWAVLRWLDVNFRHVNRLAASDRIVMVDIDDYAVERIHRWPWPRRLHAELITTLNELGARAILMDVVFAEPMAPRLEDPRLHRDGDVDVPGEVHGSLTPEDAIRDDDELAAALAAGGNVYLAMYYRPVSPDQPLARLARAAGELFASDPRADLATFRAALPFDPGEGLERLYHYHRLRRFLLEDFTLTREELAERLDASSDELDRHFAEAKRRVARELAGRILADEPGAGWAEVHARVLPAESIDTLSADREDVLRAFRSMRARRVVVGSRPATPASLRGRVEQGTDLTPPLDKLAEVARRVGFVTFEKDADGVLRRIPLVIDVGGHLVPQLGFAVACDVLGIDEGGVRLERGRLILPDAAGATVAEVPVGRNGRTLLNWHIDRARPRWQHSFDHLPVSAVMELVFNRRAIEQNAARRAIRRGQAVAVACGDQRAVYEDYAGDVRERNRLRRELRYLARSDAPRRQELEAVVERLNERIATREAQAVQFLEQAAGQLEGLGDRSAEEEQLLARIAAILAELSDPTARAETERLNAALRARNAELAKQLRARVADRICCVGYTASAVADLVSVPVFPVVPGVMAHANVINGLLLNRFPQVAPRWVNVLGILLFGAVVTVVTVSRGPWFSLASVLLLIALILTGSLVVFGGWGVFVAGIVSAAAVFVGWAFITLYRQLVEQRAKRQFSRALAQYTSPAVAARIAESADPQDLAPRRGEVTCFFSDLKGFTAISERLGAERTREILNPYLEVMSAVLVEHRAIVNKFMGDGIFAFFNPPILPCPDHARAACEAALDSLAALERLKSEHAGAALGEDIAALSMRIGINSGAVFVGDYGSVNKLDYTCIGDVVNLAARLEPANKAFGTRIMISQATRTAVGEGFEVRPLGRLQVFGKRQAPAVFELLGRPGEVPDDLRRYAEAFGEVVRCYQERRWDDVLAAVRRCAESRDRDPALALYRGRVEELRTRPLPDDWNASIELTSK